MIKQSKQTGFTIVELLVIIAVIAILAGVTVVGYGAWRKNILTEAVKSDLSQIATAYLADQNWQDGTNNTGYSSSLPSSVSPSENVTVTGGGRPGGATYCVAATATDDPNIKYYISDKQKTPAEGDCTPKFLRVFDTGNAQVDMWGTVTTGVSRTGGLAVGKDGTVYVANGGRQAVLRLVDIENHTMTAFSGSGVRGFVNGTAQQAQFRDMGRMVPDGSGGFLMGDVNNNMVRRIASDGSVSTFANIWQASGLARDKFGFIYVTNGDSSRCLTTVSNGHRVQKLSPSGSLLMTVGSGICGYVDGDSASAQFSNPYSAAVSSDGTIYVTESSMCTIRKITPTGQVSTYTGTRTCSSSRVDGTLATAQYRELGALAIDNRDTLYVTDHGAVRAITKEGEVTTLVNDSNLARPGGFLVFDNGNLWGAGDLGGFVYKVTIP